MERRGPEDFFFFPLRLPLTELPKPSWEGERALGPGGGAGMASRSRAASFSQRGRARWVEPRRTGRA